MAMAPDMDIARMEHTMRVLEYEGDQPRIKRFLEKRLGTVGAEAQDPRYCRQPLGAQNRQGYRVSR